MAIEATGAVCGVALVQDGALAGAVRLAHGMNLSGSLLHGAEWLLEQRGLSLAQMDAFAVDVGPGAFTGLKIGVMLAKSWAHALGKPLIAVSAFEACAAQMPTGAPTLIALPARRDALYLQWLLPVDEGLPQPLGEPAFIVRDALGEWLTNEVGSPRMRGEPAGEGGIASHRRGARARVAQALLAPRMHWRIIDAPACRGRRTNRLATLSGGRMSCIRSRSRRCISSRRPSIGKAFTKLSRRQAQVIGQVPAAHQREKQQVAPKERGVEPIVRIEQGKAQRERTGDAEYTRHRTAQPTLCEREQRVQQHCQREAERAQPDQRAARRNLTPACRRHGKASPTGATQRLTAIRKPRQKPCQPQIRQQVQAPA
jgi:tRNA threonylcarbamoyl adenosine modification protein YeaZ